MRHLKATLNILTQDSSTTEPLSVWIPHRKQKQSFVWCEGCRIRKASLVQNADDSRHVEKQTSAMNKPQTQTLAPSDKDDSTTGYLDGTSYKQLDNSLQVELKGKVASHRVGPLQRCL